MRSPRAGTTPCCVEVAAVKIRVGDDGPARHLVEGDVLGRQIGRTGHHHGVAHALGVLQRPRLRLHAAQAAAQHRGQLRDAQAVQQPGLGIDPVFYRHHRKVGTVHRAGVGVDVHWARWSQSTSPGCSHR